MRKNRAAINNEYEALLGTALGSLTKKKLSELAREPELKIVLGAKPGGYHSQFFSDLISFMEIDKEKEKEREDFIIDMMLEHSSAITSLAPAIHLGGIRLMKLPYHRPLAKPYDYSKFNFSGALLHHAALINAIKGGADITNIAWEEVGPDPKMPHSIYSDQEKRAYLLIQTIVMEARNLQNTLTKVPAGFQILFERILNPSKPVLETRQKIQELFTARRSWWLTSCINSFFRGRAPAVEEFYQKWSRQLAGTTAAGETTGLVSGQISRRYG